MLGLGNSIASSSAVSLPSFTLSASSTIFLTTTTSPDEGDGVVSAASTSTFDVRLVLANADYDVASDTPGQFTFNNITVENTTASSGVQTLSAGPLIGDSELDFVGAGTIIYVFDDSSAMDDVDLGSSSGATAAHNGSGSNTFRVSLDVQRQGYSGVISLTKDFSLTDSDA